MPGRDAGRRHIDDQLAAGREDLVNLCGLLKLGVSGGEKEVFPHLRFQVNESGYKTKQKDGQRQHQPMTSWNFPF